jgi:hypothetical protein
MASLLPGAGASNPLAPPLRHSRTILIRAKNLLYLSEWEYGKRQLYGSAVETVQESGLPSTHQSILGVPYFRQDGIKAEGVALLVSFCRKNNDLIPHNELYTCRRIITQRWQVVRKPGGELPAVCGSRRETQSRGATLHSSERLRAVSKCIRSRERIFPLKPLRPA